MSNVTPTPIPTHPPVNDAGDGQVISERQAKQGNRGRHMFVVLGVSVALAVVAMFGIWGLHAPKMNAAAHASGASKAAAAQTFDAGPSQPKPAPNTR
jgi:flagellar basal body-associated protein FliL